jgi:hypothetical protein
MSEEVLLYIDSDQTSAPGEMPLRFPFTDGGAHQVAQPVHELDSIEVVISSPQPGAQYALRVGDKEFAPSMLTSGLIFDSQKLLANYRGWVPIQIVRTVDGESATTEIELACLPSKLTEDQYQVMVEEIDRVSRDLILDVVGARTDVGWRGRAVTTDFSRMEEHEAINALLDRIRPDIHRLRNEQVLRIKVERRRVPCWGHEDLDHRSIIDLAASGVDPHDPSNRPFLCNVRQRTLTSELHENRQIGAFLRWLNMRLRFVVRMVEAQMEQLDEDRWWRDSARSDRKSIWELEDAPKRKRMEAIVETCKELRRSIRKDLQDLPFLDGGTDTLDLRPTSIFLRHPIYSRLYRAILGFLRSHGAIFDRADFETQARVKGTDKLYEYWVYLSMVRYLQERAGLPVEEYGELYERSAKVGSYTLNIDRSYVTFSLGEDRTLRLYYTPLIFRKDEAAKRGDAFYRFGGGLPYSPDYLIEVRQGELLEMGVILDAKYMKEVSRESRSLRKYLPAIRDAYSDDVFSRTLWIIYVGDAAEDDGEPPCHVEIHSDQPAFIHNDSGRVQVRSERSIAIGTMRFAPRPWEGTESSQDQLHTLFRPLLEELGIHTSPLRPVEAPSTEAVVGMGY